MTPPILITKYGRARIDSSGYYRITSRKEGNHHKLLHRLIFEEFHGPIPEGFIIHPSDGDIHNNCLLNLELMSSRYHQNLHNIGNDEMHRNISLARNKTGYRNVSINRRSIYKQGFIYRYRYYEDGKHKAIYSVNIDNLREKVLAKGLVWEQFEEATA